MNTARRIQILRVLGARSATPSVIAFVDGQKVTWNPDGWLCDCPRGDFDCGHVDVVAELLDPKVTEVTTPEPPHRNTPRKEQS